MTWVVTFPGILLLMNKATSMLKFYTFVFFFLMAFAGCKTAGKSFEKGDYTQAIELGIKKLQKDPNDAETIGLMKDAYRLAVNRHEDNIRSLSNRKGDDKYAAIYNEYAQLQNLYELVNRYPAAMRVLDAVNYSSYLDTYADKAVDVHLAHAEKWEDQKTKAGYRQAYNEYKKALRYKPQDVALKQKRDELYNLALTKVLVLPMQQQFGGYGYTNNYQFQNFQNELMRTLSFQMGNDMVRFYSEWELRNKDLEPDQVLEFTMTRMHLGRPYDQQSVRQVSKKVVVKETVYKPDSVVKEYANVQARIITTQRNLVSEADLYITLRDTKGRILWNDRFTGQDRWQAQSITYTGDERALSESDKSLLNRGYVVPPSEEEVLERLFRQINDQLSYRLRNYFNRY